MPAIAYRKQAGKLMIAKSSSWKTENRQGWLSVIPIILLELVICAYPILVAFMKSFTNWDGLFKNDFKGLTNYVRLLTDPEFWISLRNSGVLLLSVPIQAFIGLAIAMVFYEGITGWKFLRMVYYLPSIISAVTVGYLFKIAFGYQGPINTVLRMAGLGNLAVEWLGNGTTAIIVILLCMIWSNIGWQILVIFGGLSAIPASVFDAAKIDGAGYWRRFFNIVLPMLVRTLEYSLITSMLWVFNGIFPLILTITNGGPGYETTTVDYMIYIKGFMNSRFGMACAQAMVLLLIIIAITKLQMFVTNKLDDWGE